MGLNVSPVLVSKNTDLISQNTDKYSPLLRLGEEVAVGRAEEAEGHNEQQQLAVYQLVERPTPHEQQASEPAGGGGRHLVLVTHRHGVTGEVSLAGVSLTTACHASLFHNRMTTSPSFRLISILNAPFYW